MNFKSKTNPMRCAGVAAVLIAGLLLGSCNRGSIVGMGPFGAVYTSNKIGIAGNSVEKLWDLRPRQACTQRINFYLFSWAWGDGSTAGILKRSEMKQIYAIDRETFSILGVYSRMCTLVYGE